MPKTANETLTDILLRRIRHGGPLTLAEYMAAALHHPDHGYYRMQNPLGAGGDFTTAPEISQMFGELLGCWMVDVWQQTGAPKAARLVELGPGRGLLMADMLRAIAKLPQATQAFAVDLVETNISLRQIQARALPDAQADWHEDLSSLKESPWFLVANEFFDAMPIHQLVRAEGAWREKLVTAHPDKPGFAFALDAAPSPRAALLPHALLNDPTSDVAELCPAADAWIATIAAHIAAHGGAALIIDYGSLRDCRGATLQALRNHRKADPLSAPGSVDISSHVDFARLARAAEAAGAKMHGPVDQGAFLCALGIRERAEILGRNRDADGRRSIGQALQRLIGATEMGTLFKAVAITAPDFGIPPGFEASA